MARFWKSTREQAHLLKRRVLARPRLRARLRRWLVTPYQLWQLRRLAAVLPAPEPADPTEEAPRVLLLAFRHWAVSRAWESVFTRLLRRQGCRVTWVYDDRVMVRCDSMPGPEPDIELCRHCMRFNRRAAAVMGVQAVALGDFLLPEPESTAPDGSPAEDFEGVAASFQRLLAAQVRDPDALPPTERRMLDELKVGSARVRRAADGLLDALEPDAVVALNGKFFGEARVLEAARRRGIPVWTYERGNRRDTVVLAPTPTAVPFDTGELLETLDEPLTAAEEAVLDRYLDERMRLGNGQVRFLAADARSVRLPPARRRLVLFTNLIWDSAVVGEDTIFPDMFDWVIATVRAVAQRPDVQLAVRVHPAEVKVYWHLTRQRVADVLTDAFPEGLPPNVALIDADEPVDSYELVRQADAVLVYTSTIGQEAAGLGKRVVVAARSAYSAAPFVVRPVDRAAYLDEVTDGSAQPPPRAAERARRFMYRLYFEEMLPVPGVREDPTGFRVVPDAAPESPLLENRLARLAAAARAHRDRRLAHPDAEGPRR